ncbi:MAG TPA: AarF/UbiB family protein, partial [bacterium]|nr:AarF/UbiB family protein [bacterium]
VLEALGTTFVKLGQFFSMRPDIIPEEICRELRSLQDDVPPVDFARIREEIVGALGCDIGRVFSAFEPVPVASGSIGQVHLAVLREGEVPVACKVRRPGARRQVRSDFDIIGLLARLAHENIPEIRYLDLPALIEEAKSWLLEETDFENEKNNLLVFGKLNRVEGVLAPRVLTEYSSPAFLVLERLDGLRAADLAGSEARRRAAERLAGSFFNQVLLDGFFHGDPHGGNVFFRPSGEVVLLDWGLVGRLSWKMRLQLVELLQAVLSGDPSWTVECGLALSENESVENRDRLESDLLRLLDEIRGKPLSRINVGHFLIGVFQVLARYRIRVRSGYMLVARALMLLEGLVRELDPEFDIMGRIRAYLPRVGREALKPDRFRSWAVRRLFQVAALLDVLPTRLQDILRKLDEGKLTVVHRHTGMEDVVVPIRRAIDRLVLGMIMASLISASICPLVFFI